MTPTYSSIGTNGRWNIPFGLSGSYGIMWGTFLVEIISFGDIYWSPPYQNELNERAKK